MFVFSGAQETSMGYQVTARKWRPQTFDDIVEQRHVTRTLKNAIALGRVAHAYLFAGTRGVGKTTMARVLAKALNCERGPTTDPCNACSSCLEIIQGASLDILEIDGASNRGIDEIRDLRERLRYLPSRGRYKVYIIDEVHMLTKEAFNALLKTLEEPPPHVVFIFATTELEKIPHTILSRCQRFEFKRVSLRGIVEQLENIVRNEGVTISRASLLRVAKAAEGSMRDAQSLLDQVVAYCGTEVDDTDVSELLGHVGSERLAQCLQALFQQDAETALRLADQLQAEGQEAVGIVRALLEGLRHLIVLKTTQGPHELIPLSEAEIAALCPVADMVSVEDIYGFFHVLSAAENSLRYASNPFLILEMALVRMACIGRVQPLQTILDTLQSLGAGSSSATPQIMPALASPANSERPSRFTLGARGNVKPSTDAGLPPSTAPEMSADATDAPEVPRPAAPSAAADFWPALQEHVAGRRPSIAAFLQAGRVLAQTDKELVIGFAKQDSFSRETLLEPENLIVVREAVHAVLGRPLQVKIEALDRPGSADNGTQGVAGGPSANVLATEELQRQKRETIQAVLDIFDGRLIM
jgi:DNA polymerase-3 subunit gamma/tau